ncbi:MAG: hypothetical protein HYX95_01285, partial [Chloroflexi bacterium]|nr:hypothetical protein [Chloroflexota bacterium]
MHWVLKKVCDESYRPLVGLFHSLAQARVTVNINAVLTEMLHEHCMSDVIDGIKELAVQGRIELTGSAKYHAILPLLPESEVLRQIVLNQQVNRRFFGKAYAPQGFFPPEMCYGASIAKTVIETGHRWIILGGVACPAEWPTEVVYKVSTNGQQLATFFRDDVLSNRISFKQTDARQFIEHLRGMGRAGRDTYVVTAMDAETFGHHIPRWEKLFLARVYQGIKSVAEGIAGPESGTDRGGAGSVTSRTEPPDPPRGRRDLRPPRRPAGADEIQAVTLSQLLELMPVGEAVEPR